MGGSHVSDDGQVVGCSCVCNGSAEKRVERRRAEATSAAPGGGSGGVGGGGSAGWVGWSTLPSCLPPPASSASGATKFSSVEIDLLSSLFSLPHSEATFASFFFFFNHFYKLFLWNPDVKNALIYSG